MEEDHQEIELEEYQQRLARERFVQGTVFIAAFKFPPHVHAADVTFHYDDGHVMLINATLKDPARKTLWKRMLHKCRIG